MLFECRSLSVKIDLGPINVHRLEIKDTFQSQSKLLDATSSSDLASCELDGHDFEKLNLKFWTVLKLPSSEFEID
jgi:hypothetical protein